jgi:hypothetical protein
MNHVDYNQIIEIYNKFIAPKLNDEYNNRYKKLPMRMNNDCWNWRHKDFSRVIAMLEFRRFTKKNRRVFEHALISNGTGDPELRFIKYKNVSFIDYEKDKKYDLQTLKMDKKYDFFMSNQTLEHTYDPCLIFRNIYEIMNKDGIVYMNVPSLSPPHNTPHHHYSGFTPVGLGCIAKQAGFEILDIGFWGNKEYVMYMFSRNDWPDYTQLQDYTNDFKYSVTSWIFAKKV